jgi:PAS domain S-box-containing protein
MSARGSNTEFSTILLVEDSGIAREQVIKALGPKAYHFVEARDATEAMRLAEEELPDLVILDLMLPGTDGLEVMRRLRAELPTAEVPVLILTAREDEELRLKCFQAGADDFFTKRGSLDELKSRVRSITRLNRFRTLRRERAKARMLLESAPDGVVLLDMKGKVLEVSKNAVHLFGVGKPSEIIGRQIEEILPSPDRGPLKILLQTLENSAHPADSFEQVFNMRGGTRVTLRVHYRKLVWEDRDAVLLYLQDNSERRAAQDAVQRLRQTWRLIGRDAGLGVLECELRTRALRVSDSWRDMFFYDPLSAPRTFKGYLDLVHEEDRESFAQEIEANIARSTERFNLTCRLLDGAGRYRVVDASFWVIPDVAGGAQRLIAWQRETDDKVAEEILPDGATPLSDAVKRLEPGTPEEEGQPLSPSDFAPLDSLDGLSDTEAVPRLKRFLRARDNLLVNLGHELDTQLNALLGLSHLLLEGTLGPLTARQNQCLRKIERQLRHLTDLNTDIEGVINLENSDVPAPPKPAKPVRIEFE